MARTSPAQKISLGHHACLGGRGTCDGSVAERAAVGLGMDVEIVTEGTPVLTAAESELEAAWGRARTLWANQRAAATFARMVRIVESGGKERSTDDDPASPTGPYISFCSPAS